MHSTAATLPQPGHNPVKTFFIVTYPTSCMIPATVGHEDTDFIGVSNFDVLLNSQSVSAMLIWEWKFEEYQVEERLMHHK